MEGLNAKVAKDTTEGENSLERGGTRRRDVVEETRDGEWMTS